ncbi:unnamed protein product [Parajaminaea phylloscopi]
MPYRLDLVPSYIASHTSSSGCTSPAMVRVQIKGGVWKNTEDEILKAAISKYGMNQWARISSLLVRKTPKQCKARWYEWLDPTIKKTEWSKEEDEKLLHLAKLMPTQWRTIAPIVGRTATQCLERYQRLLDEVEELDRSSGDAAGPSSLGLTGIAGPEAAPSAEDVRRLRPGEIDPDPESKPARPDPIDMDEDEKEMLSEARARLANTQGKKAKRKERERALEEAKRLAVLQKKRELKAAGIVMRGSTKKKGGMDYNADIPFEKQPMKGFYDTSEEEAKSYQAPVGSSIGGRKRESEEQAGGRDKKKSHDAKTPGDHFGQKAEQFQKMKELESISKRRKLTLPDAQVNERELENIVKLGQASEDARDMVAGGEATEGLLTEFDALQKAKMARTPRVAPEDDTIMREAKNLKNMAMAQTPLLGDANTHLSETAVHSITTPQSSVAQTPNPLLTPARGDRADMAPRSSREPSQTPLRTPYQDALGFHEGRAGDFETPRDSRTAYRSAKQELLSGLRSLPRPKNDFELVLDEGEDADEDDGDDDEEVLLTISEDAADRDTRLAHRREEERQQALARRSQVVQRDLPRPANVDADALRYFIHRKQRTSPAQRMVLDEMVGLLKHDSVVHPLAGSAAPGGSRSDLPTISDGALGAARELIRLEMGQSIGFPGATEAILKVLIAGRLAPTNEDDTEEEARERAQDLKAFDEHITEKLRSTAWCSEKRNWVAHHDLSAKSIRAGRADVLDRARRRMAQSATDATREEQRLSKLLGGYQARSQALRSKIKDAAESLSEVAVEAAAFERLSFGEKAAIASRAETLEAEVRALENRESIGQLRYKDLDDRRRALRSRVESLQQERNMLEAEKLNDAALAMDDGDAA